MCAPVQVQPELPAQKIERFLAEYSIPQADAEILTAEKDLAEFFEQVIGEVKAKLQAKEIISAQEKAVKLATNYIITEVRKHLSEHDHNVRDLKFTPENYAELVGIVADGKINSSAAQTVLQEMYRTGADPSHIIAEKNLGQMEDEGEVEKIIEKVIMDNAKSAEDYKSGKQNALQFLVGQVMKESKGKANPGKAMEMLKNKLK